VYGRGAVDMKGGCAVNLMVPRVLKAAGIVPGGDLIVQSVVDEENGGNGTLSCLLRGYTADAMVITEPSSDIGLGIAQRGAQFFRLKISGAGGQIEVKHDLVNPIGRALEVYRAVEDYSLMRESSVSHPLYDPLYKTKAPVGICRVYGGEWPSTVPDACFMEGSIECMPGEDIETVKESFKKYLLALGLADPWFEKHPVEVRWFGLRLESAELSAAHPLVGEISRHIERVKGHLPIVGGGGGCDLRLPLLHGNTPAVIYGPGGEHAHGIDEYVEFEQVMSCLKVIASLAADWCGKAD
ncbi:MAG TPA: M20/M25/M40 family metallo-hydrolase, partial [Spirochaetes bacterium]|nr:M20/M25/M40 family metallo-hydrolase [Spirochaetota bacterium]